MKTFSPGDICLVFCQKSTTWQAALLLPTENLDKFGIPHTLEDLGLTSDVPECYNYDGQNGSLTWRRGYAEGGTLVSKRKHPVMFFDGADFPRKCAVGWVAVENLQVFNAKNSQVRQLIENPGQVMKYIRERDKSRQHRNVDAADKLKQTDNDASESIAQAEIRDEGVPNVPSARSTPAAPEVARHNQNSASHRGDAAPSPAQVANADNRQGAKAATQSRHMGTGDTPTEQPQSTRNTIDPSEIHFPTGTSDLSIEASCSTPRAEPPREHQPAVDAPKRNHPENIGPDTDAAVSQGTEGPDDAVSPTLDREHNSSDCSQTSDVFIDRPEHFDYKWPSRSISTARDTSDQRNGNATVRSIDGPRSLLNLELPPIDDQRTLLPTYSSLVPRRMSSSHSSDSEIITGGDRDTTLPFSPILNASKYARNTWLSQLPATLGKRLKRIMRVTDPRPEDFKVSEGGYCCPLCRDTRPLKFHAFTNHLVQCHAGPVAILPRPEPRPRC